MSIKVWWEFTADLFSNMESRQPLFMRHITGASSVGTCCTLLATQLTLLFASFPGRGKQTEKKLQSGVTAFKMWINRDNFFVTFPKFWTVPVQTTEIPAQRTKYIIFATFPQIVFMLLLFCRSSAGLPLRVGGCSIVYFSQYLCVYSGPGHVPIGQKKKPLYCLPEWIM